MNADFETSLRLSVQSSHIRELQRQLGVALRENATLKEKLAAWPSRALECALKARESERERNRAKHILHGANYADLGKILNEVRGRIYRGTETGRLTTGKEVGISLHKEG